MGYHHDYSSHDYLECKANNAYSYPTVTPTPTRYCPQRNQSPSPTKSWLSGGFHAEGRFDPAQDVVDVINAAGTQTGNIIYEGGRAVSSVVTPVSHDVRDVGANLVNPRGQQTVRYQPPTQVTVYPPGGGQQTVESREGQRVWVPPGHNPPANAYSNPYGSPSPTRACPQSNQAPSPTKSWLSGGIHAEGRFDPAQDVVNVINAAGTQTGNIIYEGGRAVSTVVTPVSHDVRDVGVNLVNPRGQQTVQYQPPTQVTVYPPGGGQQQVNPREGQWVWVPPGHNPPANAYSNPYGSPLPTRSFPQGNQGSAASGGFYAEGNFDPAHDVVDLINAAGTQTGNVIGQLGRAVSSVVTPVAYDVLNVAKNLINPRGQQTAQYQPPTQVTVYPPGGGQQTVESRGGQWYPPGQPPPMNDGVNPPPTRSSPTKCSKARGLDFCYQDDPDIQKGYQDYPDIQKGYQDICYTLQDMDRCVNDILSKLE